VKVKAVALNYRDKMMIESGMGLTLPQSFTPASDMAGEVDAVGPGVSRFQPGARVISTFSPGWIDGRQKPYGNARQVPYHTLGGFYQGVLAEYVILHEDWLVAAPASLDDVQASTLPCAGLTAWSAVTQAGGLTPGNSVLIQGTGGVSLFALQ
ncbi:alcohol dehydrogenase catalytic domain-containing protein, partial [Escherichia coli]|uniref:alcohol dehydrogenase catalytic domain-containing protein n=1 Tax=Escherichia coli TaxID=562 RepID=UPI0012908668